MSRRSPLGMRRRRSSSRQIHLSVDALESRLLMNSAPYAYNDGYTTVHDTPMGEHVSGGDGDNDPLTYSQASGPANGTLTYFDSATGAFVYEPDYHFVGFDFF